MQELHEFLYPKDEDTEVSTTVQQISDNISYITGVVRPAELDAETTEEAENENVPVITTEETGNDPSVATGE